MSLSICFSLLSHLIRWGMDSTRCRKRSTGMLAHVESNAGVGGYGAGMGMWGGGGSAAFSMGHTMAVGGLGAGAFRAAAGASAAAGPMLAQVLSRAAEKHNLSGLNECLSGYMAKVRQLQQENVVLEDRLVQLTGGEDMTNESTTTTAEYKTQLIEYHSKLESLTLDTVKLEIELDGIRGTAHEMKTNLKDELDFITKTQDECMGCLCVDVYISTFILDEVQAANATSAEFITTSKAEISASRKELQALSLELQSLNMSLERSFAEAHAQSSGGVAEYQTQIRGLEGAIEVAKVDLHKQILSHQGLLDVKLALDTEITTYRTLLDWDDLSMSFTKTSYTYTGEKTVRQPQGIYSLFRGRTGTRNNISP
uniref:Zgc:136930 n=1 Tax=Hucho hucho TaxID=62062 RepID=A0A4W5NDL9_9TELE